MITYNYGNSHSPITLLQMVGDHDLPGIENEIREIHRLTDQEFAFVAVKVENWNHDLSPWNAPAVFGTEDFGDGAENTLEEVLQLCTDNDRKYCIGGYSMAGLFALWAAMQTDRFKGVAATSPSVWFPGFLEDMKSRRVGSDCIYLSLGDKEEIAARVAHKESGDGAGGKLHQRDVYLAERRRNTVYTGMESRRPF